MIAGMKSRTRRQRGNALVEFAVVGPLLLTFLFAIFDFGRALYTYHFVCNAAREGTRYAIVRGSKSAIPATQSSIQTYLGNVPMGIDPNKLTVTTIWPTNNNPGSVVQVTVQYNFNFFMPFMPATTIVMKSSSQMYILL